MATDAPAPGLTARHVATAAAVLLVAHLLDGWAFSHLVLDGVNSRDWGRLLRVMGFLPTWFVAALALWLCDRAAGLARPGRRALLLAAAPLAGGAAAEILKLLLRRERPNLHDGAYVFRAFTDNPWSTKSLGLPSSHALVAFSATALLARLFPAAWPVWWALGWGCALTRVLDRKHFLSDVAAAAVVGWLVGWLLWRRCGAPREAAPAPG